MAKITLDQIKNEIAVDGWTLLSTEYKNLSTELKFECSNGHPVFATWQKIRTKRECPVCKQLTFKSNAEEVVPKPKGVKRTLALDQSSRVTGYAIFDDAKLVKYGTFSTSAAEDIDRFARISAWLLSIINSYKPDYIGIEGIQFQEEGGGQKMGITVFQTLARLQGVLMMICHNAGIPFEICPTNTWRHHCGVKGKTRADKKRSTQLLIQEWYNIKASEDEADAIGIGRYLVSFIQKNTTITNWEI